jgi:hypothetical protein
MLNFDVLKISAIIMLVIILNVFISHPNFQGTQKCNGPQYFVPTLTLNP